jgi:hypothetical protein
MLACRLVWAYGAIKKNPAHPLGCAGLLWLEERLRGH